VFEHGLPPLASVSLGQYVVQHEPSHFPTRQLCSSMTGFQSLNNEGHEEEEQEMKEEEITFSSCSSNRKECV
jgi:hypothetical protein